jgi:hypothetical protein
MPNPNPPLRSIIAAALLALALAGCSSSNPGVEPGDGPAATEETQFHGPIENESGEPSEPPAPATVPNFHQKYTYEDGVEVEIIRIDKGRMTRKDIEDEFNDQLKVGTGWVRFTGRIRNGAKQVLDAELVSATATYGPDGVEAETLYFNDRSDFSGKILPGRAKSATATFAIPEKYWGDVVFEVSIGDEFEREPVIFVGSVK